MRRCLHGLVARVCDWPVQEMWLAACPYLEVSANCKFNPVSRAPSGQYFSKAKKYDTRNPCKHDDPVPLGSMYTHTEVPD